MNEDRILTELAPPVGGWQRLLTRRDVPPRDQLLALPLAAAVTLALVLLLVLPQTAELHLPWIGGRLVAQPSEGVDLRIMDHGRATELPSDDPRVRFYWLQQNETP